ncbi:pheromone A receptor-domain-containing protein [Xylaria sp. FL1777]|nr:pheromone A receptor-domain-containing protein [Xylaria sp. FL1777]
MAQTSIANQGLVANLIARVILAFAGILLCWVPFRLLVRNGEFAVVVLIIDVTIMNFFTILNSIIWHSDDWNSWWDGKGLCDVEVYISGPLQTIYAASIFTVMYHLAQQVKITGAGRDRSLRTRRNLIQAAIIFPIPFVQLLFTYFDLAQRYIIGTLIGCSAVYDSSWPKNLVYDAPPALFAVLSVPYAVLVWRRYHIITKQTQGIFKSNSQASIRANRTRIRLFNMSLSILVVYLPVMVYYFICNIQDTLSSYKQYDYNRMRWSATPYPWETILFVPSWIIPSSIMNQPWIPIATTAAIVAFFGMTMEARQVYRQYAEYIGLGTCFRKFRSGNDQDPSSIDDSGGTRESRKTLLPSYTKDSTRYHRDPNSIIPTIEQPSSVRIPEPRPSRPPRRYHHATPSLSTPPVIPPRYSSLRMSLAFRTPTLQSIKRTIRLASAWSVPRSQATSDDGGGGGASNDTTGNLTSSSRADSIPMLPLGSVPRRGAGNNDVPDPFMSRRSPTDYPAGRGAGNARPVSRLQMRIPVAHERAASGRYGDGGRTERGRGGEGDGFPRETTLTSLFTTSDTSYSSAG